MGGVHSVGPHQALAISGGCCVSNTRIVVGTWAWAWWWVTDVQKIALGIRTLHPICHDVMTAEGVPLTCTGVAQVKVFTAPDFMKLSVQQFLGKSEASINSTLLHTLEGHFRAILSTLTVEEINGDRIKFAKLVSEMASPDLGRMGIVILSFTIKDVHDDVDHLESLGKARTAEVKRDAAVGVALAARDAGVRQAECLNESEQERNTALSQIEMNKKLLAVEQADCDKQVQTGRADADLAKGFQGTIMEQQIRKAELEVDVVERRKQIEIEEIEVRRKEKELVARVQLPADAEAYQIRQVAEGQRKRGIVMAEGEAEAIKLVSGAEAGALEARGGAEAEGMRLKAQAFSQYGEAATLGMVLDSLPGIAAEVAAPLARTDTVIVLSGEAKNKIPGSLAALPSEVLALTGVDITSMLPGAKSL